MHEGKDWLRVSISFTFDLHCVTFFDKTFREHLLHFNSCCWIYRLWQKKQEAEVDVTFWWFLTAVV